MGFRTVPRLSDLADARPLRDAVTGQAPEWAGDRWRPAAFTAAAILVVSEAETFTEAGVTLAYGQTNGVNNVVLDAGRLRLNNEGNSTKASLNATSNTTGTTAAAGIFVRPNSNGKGIRVDRRDASVTRVRLLTGNGTTLLATATPDTAGIADLIYPVVSGTEYLVLGDAGGTNAYTMASANQSSPAYPINSSDGKITVTAGRDQLGQRVSSVAYNFFSAILLNDPVTTGSVSVAWPMPSSVAAWDIIAYDLVAGATGSAVTVDVQSLRDSAWGTRIAGVADNGSINSIPATENVRLLFNLSRNAPTDLSPAVEWAARRYRR